MIMMKTEQRQREDDESKQEWHRELKKGNVIQIICNVFIYIVDFLPRLFASYYVLACEKFPNKSKSFVKHSFTTSNFFILQYSHKDCLASYATETVMQYCHGRRRVCRCCSVYGTFLIEKHF